ncbi:MAG: polysaccharide biosynthesis tyrosine autokinase [Rhodobacteraceae bacterium]|nr:polysaccharide biosynthesis tyrosine autokinase [Paracoccaceae bacterium]
MKSVQSSLMEAGFEPVSTDMRDQDAIDLQDLARSLWDGRFVVLFCALLFGAIALFIASQITPTYTSISKVLLDPRESVLMEGQQVVGNLELSDQVVASEIAIMRSNLFIEEVIGAVDAKYPDILYAIDPAAEDPSFVALMISEIKALLPFLSDDAPALTEAQIRARVDRLIWAVRKNTSASRNSESFTITIAAKTPDPALSAALAGTIADVYIDQQLETRQSTASQANRWIKSRISDLAQQVEDAEAAVEDYRANSFDNFGTSLDLVSRRVEQLNDQLIQTRIDLVVAETQYKETASLFRQRGFETLGTMVTSNLIDDLMSQRARLQQADAQWAKRFDEEHFKRVELKERITDIEDELNREFERALVAQRNEVEIARTRVQTMVTSLDEAESQYLAISRATNGLRQLERSANAARVAHTELLGRFAETSTQEQFQQAEARLIERAVASSRPSAPRPKLMTVIGLFVGAAIGFGIVVFRSLVQGTYRTMSDLEKDAGLPALSALEERNWTSYAQALKDLQSDPYGPVAESLKSIRNQLRLARDDGDSESVAFLSAVQDEGKTVMSALLASQIEKSDKLVIVVDCDLRQNSLQSEFGWKMAHDLGDVIRGKCDVLDAVYADTGLGFDVLASRAAGQDGKDQITTEWLHEVIEELKRYYDLVIVNCPPILPVADATSVAQAVDKHVMLVRHDDTPRNALKRALTVLRRANIRVSGLVMNRMDPKEAARMGSTYQYGNKARGVFANV